MSRALSTMMLSAAALGITLPGLADAYERDERIVQARREAAQAKRDRKNAKRLRDVSRTGAAKDGQRT